MHIEIINGLWIGNRKDAFDKSFLESREINIIINVTNEVPFIDNEFIEKIRIPVSDKYLCKEDLLKHNNDISHHLDPISNYIRKKLSIGKNILIHCNKGKFRSTTVLIAFLLKFLRYPLLDIMDMIRTKYPLKPLDKHLFKNALINFENQIKSL